MKFPLAAFCCCLLAPAAFAEEGDPVAMTETRLQEVIAAYVENGEARGAPNVFAFEHRGLPCYCVSDENADRMRILCPIVEADDLDEAIKDAMLEANFHSALDARYATSNGIVYATFIHPLSPLSEGEIRSAVDQVATLADTFGTTWTSGALVYDGRSPEVGESGSGGSSPESMP